MNSETIFNWLCDKRNSAKWLLFFAAVILFAMLGTRGLWTQEWRWANITWNMLVSGDYFHPYLNKSAYYDKPLLSYWLMLGFSYITRGLSTWSLRLPIALSGLLAVFCTYRIGSLLFNRQVGLLAGWILISTFYFIFWSRTASADILNVAGIMLALYWYVQKREQPSFLNYTIYFLILAVSALLKGLVAPVISLLAIVPDLCAKQQWRIHLRWQLLPALIPAMMVYVLPFLLSSYVGNSHYHENGLYEVYKENILRYFQPFDHEDPIYTYFIYLPIYLLPWTIFFIPAVVSLCRRWHDLSSRVRWLMWSTLIIFIFLTLSGSRRSYYILPLVPFAVLLTAHWLVPTHNRKAAIMIIGSYLLMFVYYGILQPVYNHNGNKQSFVNNVQKIAGH